MKRIRLITVALILAIVISASSAIAVINGKNVKALDGAEMAENTSTSVSVKWASIKGADGYKIYSLNNKTNEYELVKKLIDGKASSYELGNLPPATVTKVKVSAYKIFNNKEYDGEACQPIDVYTLPEKPALKASSAEEGILSLAWEAQSNTAGYEVGYSKDKEFKEDTTANIDGGDANSFKVDGLTPKDVIYSHIRSYMMIDDKKVYGEWSDIQQTSIKEKFVMPKNIDPSKPMVALSFDDGPAFYDGSTNSTKEILDVLEEYGARATFFMVGCRINNTNKDLLKRELSLGCEIGSHTYDHSNYGKKVTVNDIKKNTDVIKKACGQAPTIFRCPGGMMSSLIQKECEKEGMPIAYWSVDTEDWKSKNPKSIYKIATKYVYDGSIILMHDIYPTTVKAVKKIVPKLIEDGYQIVTVSEMLAIKNGGKAPKAGQQYVDYKTINNNT